ncbi:fungal hydrophobin [Armillaria solidipes]|uniref:Hydrophobin n=1 Tax=Armillaria solidipes TaxID=1076256 RepID=A0A2H3BFL1_9AGAR|nr:fungal hydrophobin [Armillaria solidipes]
MLFPRVVPAFLLALPLLASAGDAGCTTGQINCCQQVESAESNVAQALSGLLGIALGALGLNVGLTCSPISVIGIGGNSCSAQTVCCTGNSFNGLIALGCTPINIGL